ncbi:hypothetical protein MNV49_007132 [Pseudohyphozyma bogoriensis]|nr:hypothetical protein MNV49_007132 [Pseudohyphozyma bogoriensis]
MSVLTLFQQDASPLAVVRTTARSVEQLCARLPAHTPEADSTSPVFKEFGATLLQLHPPSIPVKTMIASFEALFGSRDSIRRDNVSRGTFGVELALKALHYIEKEAKEGDIMQLEWWIMALKRKIYELCEERTNDAREGSGQQQGGDKMADEQKPNLKREREKSPDRDQKADDGSGGDSSDDDIIVVEPSQAAAKRGNKDRKAKKRATARQKSSKLFKLSHITTKHAELASSSSQAKATIVAHLLDSNRCENPVTKNLAPVISRNYTLLISVSELGEVLREFEDVYFERWPNSSRPPSENRWRLRAEADVQLGLIKLE